MTQLGGRGSRDFWLPLPLLVQLHGCSSTAFFFLPPTSQHRDYPTLPMPEEEVYELCVLWQLLSAARTCGDWSMRISIRPEKNELLASKMYVQAHGRVVHQDFISRIW